MPRGIPGPNSYGTQLPDPRFTWRRRPAWRQGEHSLLNRFVDVRLADWGTTGAVRARPSVGTGAGDRVVDALPLPGGGGSRSGTRTSWSPGCVMPGGDLPVAVVPAA